MNNLKLFDIIYGLAASDGRDAVLFGRGADQMRTAFARSQAGACFPRLWIELPLMGEPWCDVTVDFAQDDLAGAQEGFAGHDGVYADTLSWYAQTKPGSADRFALAYDTSRGDIDRPALQLITHKNRTDDALGFGMDVIQGFFDACGRPSDAETYRAFSEVLPADWEAFYMGVFPSREMAGSQRWVRVGAVVSRDAQRAYAEDAGLAREHMAGIGLGQGWDELAELLSELARWPYQLELQFNVEPGGRVQPIVSISQRMMPIRHWADPALRKEALRLFAWAENRGWIDGRWRELEGTAFRRRVRAVGEEAVLSCYPAYLKLRWCADEPLQAKTYLLAQAYARQCHAG